MKNSNQRSYSRRDFFSLGILKTVESVETVVQKGYQSVSQHSKQNFSAPAKEKVSFVRPPGALLEEDFLKKCTHCNDCIQACPHFVIRKAGYELGKEVSETPIIIPKEKPLFNV